MPEATQEAFDQAVAHHRAGRLAEARTLYLQILEKEGDHAEALHLLGVAALQAGQGGPGAQSTSDAKNAELEQGLQFVRRALALEPDNARFLLTLGQGYLALNRFDESIAAYTRATELNPQLPEAWFGLGAALQAGTKYLAAVDAYRRVLALRPDHVDAQNNLGNALNLLGKTEEAAAVYHRALELQPDRGDIHNNLGLSLQRRGNLTAAIASYRRSIQLQPDFVGAYNNLGGALTQAKELDEADAVLRHAISLSPNFAEAWFNLGNNLKAGAHFSDAVSAYRRALELRPNYTEAHINLGTAYQGLRQYKDAAESYIKALSVRSPHEVEALNNLGVTLRTVGEVDKAIKAFERALYFRQDYYIAHCNLGNAYKDIGKMDLAVASYRRAVELRPSDSISHSNLVFSVYYHPDYDAAGILRENLRYNAMHAAPLGREIPPHDNDPDPNRRLRIGYVGSDFRDHCQSFFTLPLLSNHDNARFEIFCYANVAKPDAITYRHQSLADVWRSTSGQTDARVAQQVREDKIDILVDLTMHMSNARPLLMARKPAPVQFAWLAYPGTTGLSAIDYRFTDPYLDPPGDSDLYYSEKSIRLPDTFWCYDPLTDRPEPSALPAQESGRITFGCLNNFCKVTRGTVSLWCRVMAALPDSRLLLRTPIGEHRAELIEQFQSAGIGSDRLDFVEFAPRESYLRFFHRIDIGLDTLPYNGHTTSLDSFWMGVPVVTRLGQTAVGRGGFSQLSNLSLTELAADNDDDFVKIAVALATDLPRLAELRRTLRWRMQKSPLMNGVRFAANVESAYRNVWRDWCAKQQTRRKKGEPVP
jgi:protein O-GlcNAc transferase